MIPPTQRLYLLLLLAHPSIIDTADRASYRAPEVPAQEQTGQIPPPPAYDVKFESAQSEDVPPPPPEDEEEAPPAYPENDSLPPEHEPAIGMVPPKPSWERSETPPPPPPADDGQNTFEYQYKPEPIKPVNPKKRIPAPKGYPTKAEQRAIVAEQAETPPPPPTEEEEREENELEHLKALVQKRITTYEEEFTKAVKEFSAAGYSTFMDLFSRLKTSLGSSSRPQLEQRLQDLYHPRYLGIENVKDATSKGKTLWQRFKDDFEGVINAIAVKNAPPPPAGEPSKEVTEEFFAAVKTGNVGKLADLSHNVSPLTLTEGILDASRNGRPAVMVELLQHPYDAAEGSKRAPYESTAFTRINKQVKDHMSKLFMQAIEEDNLAQIQRLVTWPSISANTLATGIIAASHADKTDILEYLLNRGKNSLTESNIEDALSGAYSETTQHLLHQALQDIQEPAEETIQPKRNAKALPQEIKKRAAYRD